MIICDKCVHKMSCIDYGTKTDQCKYCDPITNEEWRKTCSTEEFAEEMAKVVLDLVSWNNDPKPSEVRNILKAWLKRPHKNEVAK